jgi:hypothetical protein
MNPYELQSPLKIAGNPGNPLIPEMDPIKPRCTHANTMAEFGIQGCLATQEEDEEESELIFEKDEVAALKAQLAELQQMVLANKTGIQANADANEKTAMVAAIADQRSKVNRMELLEKQSPVKIEEPPAPTPDTAQTVKKKVCAPSPHVLVDLTLKNCNSVEDRAKIPYLNHRLQRQNIRSLRLSRCFKTPRKTWESWLKRTRSPKNKKKSARKKLKD